MKTFSTIAAGIALMAVASVASAAGNENWQIQRAKMDGSWAEMQAQLHPQKTPEQIQAQNEYAGKVIAENWSNYKR